MLFLLSCNLKTVIHWGGGGGWSTFGGVDKTLVGGVGDLGGGY